MLQGQSHMPVQSFTAVRSDARSQFFSEQEAFWHLPLHEFSTIVDVAVTKGKLLASAAVFSAHCHMMTVIIGGHTELSNLHYIVIDTVILCQ